MANKQIVNRGPSGRVVIKVRISRRAVAAAKTVLMQNDFDACSQGCGEMGSCHPNLNKQAKALAEEIVRLNGGL